MPGFHFSEARKNGSNAEFAGSPAVNAGKQRISQAIDHLSTVVPLNQRGHAFVAIGLAGRRAPFANHAKLRTRGKKR